MKYEYTELVTIFTTGDQGLIWIAKSILESAGIKCFARGEALQDQFALGRTGLGFNPLVGPVQIQVREEDEEDAKLLLKDLMKEGF